MTTLNQMGAAARGVMAFFAYPITVTTHSGGSRDNEGNVIAGTAPTTSVKGYFSAVTDDLARAYSGHNIQAELTLLDCDYDFCGSECFEATCGPYVGHVWQVPTAIGSQVAAMGYEGAYVRLGVVRV